MKYTKTVLLVLILINLLGCEKSKVTDSNNYIHQNKNALLLGVYHFSNPGKDTYNLKVDNYLSDKRQKEIKEVVDLLNQYKPTKILVEFTSSFQPTLDSLYKAYLENKITLNDIRGGENEVYQLGFQLGKKLGGIDIKAIDYKGNWLGSYTDFIADTLGLVFYQKDFIKQSNQIKERQEIFLKNSVKQNLIFINKKEEIKKNHNYYNNIAIKVKDTAGIMFSYQEKEQDINDQPYLMRSFDFNNIGVETVAEWYKRNLFIYRNVLENTIKGDRVLIIFGSGHMHYLNQLLKNNPDFKITEPNAILTRTEKEQNE